jgi:uncharacterized protein YcbX
LDVWREVIPNQEASAEADALMANFFGSFVVLRDQGQNFEPRLIREILECLGMKTWITTLHLQFYALGLTRSKVD